MKRLLNRSEERVNRTLSELTESWDAHTYPKVRLADVLPIEQSGISARSYRFALQSHFDFVVTDSDFNPLFAVEFDGPTHKSVVQAQRDDIKDALCQRFQLPLLRVNARYIDEPYRQMDLLAWFVNYWFAQQAINEAYETGQIHPTEYVDRLMIFSLPGSSSTFPLWLTADVRTTFKQHYSSGKCLDFGPSSFVGVDPQGNYHAISYIAVTESEGLIAETGMRTQRFQVPCADVLDAITEHQILDDFQAYLTEKVQGIPLGDIAERVRWYYDNYTMLMAGCSTQSGLLNNTPCS
ncbi:MAG: hypothetical protein RhofKO_42080 [Rhodothermales bacterium]